MIRARPLHAAMLDGLSIVAVGIFLLPVIWVALAAIRPEQDILTGGLLLHRVTLEHFAKLLERPAFLRAIGNSLVVASTCAALATAIALPAAYSLVRFRHAAREPIGLFILAMKMVPGIILLVPIVVLFRGAGLTNTLAGLALAHLALALPAAVWVLRSFVADIPETLEEAARIDGCSRAQLMRHVVLPLVLPGLLVVATFSFVLSWGEYVLALSLTTHEDVKTLPLALQSLFDPYHLSWGEIMAAGVCIATPILLLFLLFRRHLVAGLLAGSVKG